MVAKRGLHLHRHIAHGQRRLFGVARLVHGRVDNGNEAVGLSRQPQPRLHLLKIGYQAIATAKAHHPCLAHNGGDGKTADDAPLTGSHSGRLPFGTGLGKAISHLDKIPHTQVEGIRGWLEQGHPFVGKVQTPLHHIYFAHPLVGQNANEVAVGLEAIAAQFRLDHKAGVNGRDAIIGR